MSAQQDGRSTKASSKKTSKSSTDKPLQVIIGSQLRDWEAEEKDDQKMLAILTKTRQLLEEEFPKGLNRFMDRQELLDRVHEVRELLEEESGEADKRRAAHEAPFTSDPD